MTKQEEIECIRDLFIKQSNKLFIDNHKEFIDRTCVSISDYIDKYRTVMQKHIDDQDQLIYELQVDNDHLKIDNKALEFKINKLEGVANIGDTIQWELDGKTHSCGVAMINKDKKEYGVYASYGQDIIGFDDCKIIRRQTKYNH